MLRIVSANGDIAQLVCDSMAWSFEFSHNFPVDYCLQAYDLPRTNYPRY